MLLFRKLKKRGAKFTRQHSESLRSGLLCAHRSTRLWLETHVHLLWTLVKWFQNNRFVPRLRDFYFAEGPFAHWRKSNCQLWLEPHYFHHFGWKWTFSEIFSRDSQVLSFLLQTWSEEQDFYRETELLWYKTVWTRDEQSPVLHRLERDTLNIERWERKAVKHQRDLTLCEWTLHFSRSYHLQGWKNGIQIAFALTKINYF